ncbi:MAG: sodium:glutamate symporter [Tissierellia bacterium]|nr:sodium:glutamate symporter [Tissierellia bacterium]
MTVYDLFVDFTIASFLILIGQLMRSKLGIFQRFFIPASVLAGFLGLALGPSGFNILPFSGSIGSYAGILIIIVFTVVGLNGFEIEKGEGGQQAKRLIGYQIFKIIAWGIQIFVPIVFTMLILKRIWPELNDGFGLLLHSGFYGGHGTAAAVGKTFSDLGWTAAPDIAITFATIGILTGVFGGILLINIAAKKGQTAYLEDFKYVGGDLRTGLISKGNRQSMGEETISSVSLDTLAFHLSLILTIGGGSYLLNQFISQNLVSGIPDFTVAFLVALLFFILARKTPLYNYVDRTVNTRISGTATDYLVLFGIASVRLDVVMEYAGPIVLSMILGWLLVVSVVYPFGKAYNKDSWFERSIFVYGYSTGVFAIGFVLYRIVDPENKSRTIEDTAMTPFTNIAEIAIWSAFPALLINGQWLVAAGLGLAILVVSAIITKMTGTWILGMPDSERNILANKK